MQDQDKRAWVPNELVEIMGKVPIGRNTVANVGVITDINPGCTGMPATKWVSYNNQHNLNSEKSKTGITWGTNMYAPDDKRADIHELVLHITTEFDYINKKKQKKINAVLAEAKLSEIDRWFVFCITNVNKELPVYPRKKPGVNELLEAHRKFDPKFKDNDLLIILCRDGELDWNEKYVEFVKKVVKDDRYLTDIEDCYDYEELLPRQNPRMQKVEGDYVNSTVNVMVSVGTFGEDKLINTIKQIYEIIST